MLEFNTPADFMNARSQDPTLAIVSLQQVASMKGLSLGEVRSRVDSGVFEEVRVGHLSSVRLSTIDREIPEATHPSATDASPATREPAETDRAPLLSRVFARLGGHSRTSSP